MFKIKNISDDTIGIYKKCFDDNGSPKSELKIRWQFLENPIKEKFVDIAIEVEKNKAAAIYAISPVKFKLQEQEILASQSLDTITDVDYRGQGLFIKLAKNVYSNAKENNIELVYGFPNGNSIHGFSKKLDWKVLDPIPFLIKPINTSYFTKKINKLSWLPNVKIAFKKSLDHNIIIKEEFTFNEQVDIIWEKFSKTFKVSIQRNKEYLTWRYLNKPNEDYKILHAYTQTGNYIGFVVYCVKGKHGGKIGYIMEYMYDPKYKNESHNLMKEATNRIIDQKADCILGWCFEYSENYSGYEKVGFYSLPEKLRPIELHFGVCTFNKSIDDIVLDRKNWYLSYSDSDTV